MTSELKQNKMVELPLQIIELENENYHILIETKLQDNKEVAWIVDTGASKSVFDSQLSKYYEILDTDNDDDYQSAGINQGMMQTSVGKLFFLQIGDIQIVDQKVALINLNHVNDIYRKYSYLPIAGLLGGDILARYRCVINYHSKTIRFNLS
jgi:predicted aspartyl protease